MAAITEDEKVVEHFVKLGSRFADLDLPDNGSRILGNVSQELQYFAVFSKRIGRINSKEFLRMGARLAALVNCVDPGSHVQMQLRQLGRDRKRFSHYTDEKTLPQTWPISIASISDKALLELVGIEKEEFDYFFLNCDYTNLLLRGPGVLYSSPTTELKWNEQEASELRVKSDSSNQYVITYPAIERPLERTLYHRLTHVRHQIPSIFHPNWSVELGQKGWQRSKSDR